METVENKGKLQLAYEGERLVIKNRGHDGCGGRKGLQFKR